ncbi:hypothetical protein ACFFGV_04860 [Pontibacillus salicampi]|uniref:Spore coat protein n=1 Tax=Pontibacillus salicampi TaxID=1449801 RepID=A0ABV6LKK7_9BACI
MFSTNQHKPLVPLGEEEGALEEGAFLDGFPFAGFPFGGAGDFAFGVFGTLFYPTTFLAPTFPFFAPFAGPYPYGYPPIECEIEQKPGFYERQWPF